MAKRFDNKINTHRPDPNPPTVRKVPADSVLYGENVSRNGRTVWIAMEGERVVCMAATAADARRNVYDIRRRQAAKGGGGSKC